MSFYSTLADIASTVTNVMNSDVGKVVMSGVDTYQKYSAYKDQKEQTDATRAAMESSGITDPLKTQAQTNLMGLITGKSNPTYDTLLANESERFKREAIAQGWNPMESGTGRIDMGRQMGELEYKTLMGDRSFYLDMLTQDARQQQGQLAAWAGSSTQEAAGWQDFIGSGAKTLLDGIKVAGGTNLA